MRAKIEELKKRVAKEIETAQKSAKENKKSANLIAGGMASGYSIAGDLEHARNTASLSEDRLSKLIKLKEELDLAAGSDAPETVEPVSYVSIEFSNGEKKNVYLVKNTVYLFGFNLISGDSVFGKSILGKIADSEFSYTSGDSHFSGRILEIL